jgi:DNA repair protein RecO (recombination protein O)
MKIRDEAIILTTQKHGENFCKLTIFSKTNGLLNGMCRVSNSKGTKNLLAGSTIFCEINQKNNEKSCWFNYEVTKMLSPIVLNNSQLLNSINSILFLLKAILLPHQPEQTIYFSTIDFFNQIDKKTEVFKIFINYQLILLKNMGFEIDFYKCADTGSLENLEYISPKTGRAICKNSGEPYKNLLINMPEYIKGNSDKKSIKEMIKFNDFFIYKFLINKNQISCNKFEDYKKINSMFIDAI